MGFRDVIAHQYFDLDAEQVLLICQEALPGVLDAIRSLEALSRQPFLANDLLASARGSVSFS